MALILWEPVGELNTIQNEMNRLFNTFFDESTPTGRAGSPLLEDDVLTISGEREAQRAQHQGATTVPSALSAASSRSPTQQTQKGVEAHVDRGVPEIRIPKPEQKRREQPRLGRCADPTAIAESSSETQGPRTARRHSPRSAIPPAADRRTVGPAADSDPWACLP